jgi:hypothetical protein
VSVVIPTPKRLLWPIAICLGVLAAGAVALYLPTGETLTPPSSPAIVDPSLPQAKWEVKTYPAGGASIGKLSRREKASVKAQRERLSTLVKDVFDALFLAPSDVRAVLKERFTDAAARSLLSSKIGLPDETANVQIKKRSARVGVHVDSARRAAAKVTIAGKGTNRGRRVRFSHNATLWLEREKGAWKVIGFDVTQSARR